LLTVSCLVLLYLFDNITLLPGVNSNIRLFLIRPVLWMGLALLVRRLPRNRGTKARRLGKYLNFLALICGLFYLGGMIIGGMLDGFGKSPFAFTLTGVVLNIIYVSTMLWASELSRAYLVQGLTHKNAFWPLLLIGLGYTWLKLSFRTIQSLETMAEVVDYAGTVVMPVFAENILTTYLAFLGGAAPALIYQGIVQAITWFSPVLPDMGWMTKTLLGTLVPFFSTFLVQFMYDLEAGEKKRNYREKENPAAWFVSSATAVLIIWFAVGLLPVYPAVIVTGSMEPLLKPGDIALLKKINGPVQIGDVIHYRQGEIYFTHRVVDIREEGDRLYQTKGDNNPSVDTELVNAAQIKGKLISVIPKLGKPALLLRSREQGQQFGGNQN